MQGSSFAIAIVRILGKTTKPVLIRTAFGRVRTSLDENAPVWTRTLEFGMRTKGTTFKKGDWVRLTKTALHERRSKYTGRGKVVGFVPGPALRPHCKKVVIVRLPKFDACGDSRDEKHAFRSDELMPA